MSLSPEVAAASLLARFVLAGVFVVAGVAKLRDPEGTWSMLRAFGAGIRTSDSAARVLPIVELAIGAGLGFGATSAPAAIAALALLALFTSAILWNLARGRRPECRCFGQIGSAPIGEGTVVRNVVFAALAATVLVAPAEINDAPALQWAIAAFPYLAGVASVAAFAVIAFLMTQVLAQQGRIVRRLELLEETAESEGSGGSARHAHDPTAAAPRGLAAGSPAPLFELPALEGPPRSLEGLLALGKRVALFFVHPTCGPCRALVPQIAAWHAELSATTTAIVVSEGNVAENREFLRGFPAVDVVLQAEHGASVGRLAEAYAVFGTPGALIVEVDGTIASAVATGSGAISALIASARTSALALGKPETLAVGSIAPDFTAFTTKGEALRLSGWRGEEVLLIFWNPTCGFCRQAVGDVVGWERRNGRRVVVVSSAPDEDLVAGGFAGPLLLDVGARIGRLYGANGTPMALRISAEGLVVSELAAGRAAIGALLDPSSGGVAT